MTSADFVENSIAFPDEFIRIANNRIGNKADRYFATLDSFVEEFVKNIDNIFEVRLLKIQAAFNDEQYHPENRSLRITRLKIQFSEYNPVQLANDINGSISSIQVYSEYKNFFQPFIADRFVSKFSQRYCLDEASYSKIIGIATRSLADTKDSLSNLASVGVEVVKTVKQIKKHSGWKGALTAGASIVGGVLGSVVAHSLNIRRGGGRAGAEGARELVGKLIGNSDITLNQSIAAYETAFLEVEKKWKEIRPRLVNELRGVVYSIYGGAILKLLDDFDAYGLEFQLEQQERESKELIIRAHLSSAQLTTFENWAISSITIINQLIESKDFINAHKNARLSLEYIQNFEPRIKVCDNTGMGYALAFQRLYVDTFISLVKNCSNDNEVYEIWRNFFAFMIVLPDHKYNSGLIEVILLLSRLASSTNDKLSKLAELVMINLFEFYIRRSAYIFANRSDCWAFPGETLCRKSIYILYLAIDDKEVPKQVMLAKQVDKKIERILSKKNPLWTFFNLLALRKCSATFSDNPFRMLFKRLAIQTLTGILLVVAFITVYVYYLNNI